MPDPTDPRAVAAQPALGYDTDCPECSGTGQRDSGGTHPWGEPAMMMCDCDAPPPAAQEPVARIREYLMKHDHHSPPACQQEAVAFQARVAPWMDACFGPAISGDRLERGDRLLEEVLELLQSGGYPHDRIAALTGYVWSRPAGEPAQEVGGVMVTLAAYCLAHDLDMHDAGETELARIWTKVEKIRAKQAAKPTGSALPQAWPDAAPQPACQQEAVTVALKLAAARLQRLALGIPSTTPLRADVFEWAEEALRALKGENNADHT